MSYIAHTKPLHLLSHPNALICANNKRQCKSTKLLCVNNNNISDSYFLEVVVDVLLLLLLLLLVLKNAPPEVTPVPPVTPTCHTYIILSYYMLYIQ